MKKRFVCSIVTVLLAFFSVFSFGCKDDKKPNGDSTSGTSSSVENSEKPDSSTEEGNVTFFMTETLSVQEYAQAKIDYVLNGATAADIVWTTSDPAIATVENGVVAGVSAGTATITATVKGSSATCVVTVTENRSYPMIVLSQADVMPRIGGEVAVIASVYFNGALVNYSDFEWVSADTSIATVEDGVIKGVAAGETAVTVKANYGGIRLEEVIAVKVVTGPAA